ncbi:MAG: hypothetical protein KDD90_04635 [Sphingomonadaceae bacterium]|jgi:hypothetical protein|nr:hypothetical protein [Sphingomonadaceae bacterium]
MARLALPKRVSISPLVLGLALALACVASVGITWYSVDKVGMVESLCRAGLPNPTSPKFLDDDDLACAYFQPERRYFGYVRGWNGELSFTSADLAKKDENPRLKDHTVRLDCPPGGCGEQLEKELERNSIELCSGGDGKMGFSGVIVEGKLTARHFTYGHLDSSRSRVLQVERVVEVFESSDSKAEWQAAIDKVGPIEPCVERTD